MVSALATVSAGLLLGVHARGDADHLFQFQSQLPLDAAVVQAPQLRGARQKCYSG
jgi:hypothetical protein